MSQIQPPNPIPQDLLAPAEGGPRYDVANVIAPQLQSVPFAFKQLMDAGWTPISAMVVPGKLIGSEQYAVFAYRELPKEESK